MTPRPIRAADLFCGAGGTSTGLLRAAEARDRRVDLLAVNHWQTAVDTHGQNHPDARHLCAALDSLSPREVAPRGLDLLVASPECTHHSTARGGRPMSDQSRASAWHVVHWAEALRPRGILIENVREFATWGPLGSNGRPLKSRAGETFQAWLSALRSLGYRVEHRLLCAADYGDPTTRKRLFVMATRGRAPLRWPAPTHAEGGRADLFGARQPWKSARDYVVDWSLSGTSIFGRKRPLAAATIRRIEEGLRRFGGAAAEPFLAILRGTGTVRSLDRPAPALTAGGEHLALVEPFLLGQQSGGAPRGVSRPAPTVAARGAVSLVEPYLVRYQGNRDRDMRRAQSLGDPLGTLDTANRYGLVQPFIVPRYGERDGQTPRTHSLDEPMPTVPATCQHQLVEPDAVHLDIRFRMLQPHELAAAQGFPDDYQFSGNRGDAVRQIGNAVPVGLATALCGALLEAVA